jgi:propionyl-CoA carboxylase alpha chain
VRRETRRQVQLGEAQHRADVAREGEHIKVRILREGQGGDTYVLQSAWKPGDLIWFGTLNGEPVAVQVRMIANGFDLMYRGIRLNAFVYTEREATAAQIMPAKKAVDTGKALRCPMPGLVVSISVTEGQEVKLGETLAIVEAMKMENVLRAERDATVGKILAKPGDSLAVDAVILEFA